MKKMLSVIVVVGAFFLLAETNIIPMPFTKHLQLKECKLSGKQSKDKILQTYIVQSGDSLLSIASDKLGSATRIDELISFNKDTYPTLSLENPYLTEGWKLYLPPKNAGKTAADLAVVAGNVSEVTDINLIVTWKDTQLLLRPDSDTEYTDVQPLEKGTCVTVAYNATTMKVYTIGIQ